MPRPLEGITVLDLTRVLSGPFCTLVLAQLGARVIKIEAPGGDESRKFGPFDGQSSGYFASVNRGKKSVVLDLKNAPDKQNFLKLLRSSDILVENFRPGVMDRLGLDWQTLSRANPRLVYVAISGFGQTGPQSSDPAYDLVIQALGGIMSITGEPGTRGVKVGAPIGDITAGLYGAVAALSGLAYRAAHGEGCFADISMLDCQIALLENAIMRRAITGYEPSPEGNRHPSIAPFAAFMTADKPIIISAANDETFQRLCNVLCSNDLRTNGSYSTPALRMSNREALTADIEDHLATRSASEWIEKLNAERVPCGLISRISDLFDHPQIQARNMLTPTNIGAGTYLLAGNPIKLSIAGEEQLSPAPELNEHGSLILHHW